MKLLSNIIILSFLLVMSTNGMADIPIQHNDADILGVVSAIDQNEIQMAQMAESEDINHHVWDYAKMVERDHRRNLDHMMNLSQESGIIPREDSYTADHLKSHGQHEMSNLSGLHHHEFTREYISDMIKGHSEVLNWLNNQTAFDGRVQRFLDETKRTVAKHLNKAQEIQDHV